MAALEEKSRSGSGSFLVALVLVALVLVLTLAGYRPPAAKGTDAPADLFSAGRALETLAEVMGDGAPRPLGSEAHARARQRIVEVLAGLGYQPEIQTALACQPRWGNCATVRNVLARRPGRDGGPAVLLAAHYDSVAAGPGAADDGAGVATLLEIARVLAAEPPADHPVILLLDDGEEGGLLGARAFVDEHPWASEVGLVINLEARGTRGPSLMFETSPETAWLMGHYAAAIERPATSSVFYTIYQNLPNDTDFTVFKDAGFKGYNFAFVHGVEHYHRPSDRLENLSPATLQHQGDNVLALVRRMAVADLDGGRPGSAVFFDLLGWTTVRWPQGPTLPLAVVTLVLFLVAVALLLKRGLLRGAALAWGILGWLLMVIVAGAGLFGLNLLLKSLGVLPPPGFFPWIAGPTPEVAAFWALALAATSAVAVLLGRRLGVWGTWSGVWFWWTVAGLALTLVLPGVSYLFLLPALVAAVLGLLAAARGGAGLLAGAAAVSPPVVAAVLWFFLALVLYPGLGTPGLLIVGVLVALFATSLAPPLAAWTGRGRWVFPALALVGVIVASAVAFASPPYSAEVQRPLNLIYYQDGFSGLSRWLVFGRSPRALPPELRAAAEFEGETIAPFPWSRNPWFFTAPAPEIALPAPQLTFTQESAEEGGARRLRGRLVSRRGAPILTFHLPARAEVQSVALDGKEVWRRPEGGGGELPWQEVSHLNLPPEGVEVELVTTASELEEIWLEELSFGLPPGGEALQQSRPASTAPMNNGDVTVVSRAVALQVAAGTEEEGGDEEASAEEAAA